MATNYLQPCAQDQYHTIHVPALFKCTCLGIKIFQGDFSRGLFFIIILWGKFAFQFWLGRELCVSTNFFYRQIIAYVVDLTLVEEKWQWGGVELILQNGFFLNLSHFLIQLIACTSLYTFVPGFLL